MGIFMLNGRMYTGLINVYDSGWQKIGTNVKTASWTQENETLVYFLVYWNAYQLWTVFKSKNGSIRSNKIASNGDIGGDPTFAVSGSTITATWGAFNDVKILKEERNSVLPPLQYSTSEQLIGTWIDGKPLYEKTVVVPNTSQINNSFTYPHGITNQGYAKIVNAGTYDTSGSAFDLPIINNDGTNLSARLTSTDIIFRGTGALNINNNRYLYVTIQYTKTTD